MGFRPRCLAVCALLVSQVATTIADDGTDFFEQRIRPVLVTQCYECHSAESAAAEKLKGGLRLDSRQDSLVGGDTGPAVVPGAVDESLLIRALRQENGFEMPPQGKLPDHVIADFVSWIEMGAPDPRVNAVRRQREAAPRSEGEGEEDHWAFRRPKLYPLPTVEADAWPQTPWDHFVLARLEKAGLKPVGRANKRELLRRLTFDLIGLPPTIQEVESFVEDDSPNAYLKVVDRLLDSPHYGERWGRAWLDVARYADDKALAYHNPWPNAYRYRDWVVKAFNNDMSYDRFVRLQLAGDLMPGPVLDHTTRLAGLGFQGLGAFYHKGSVPKQVKADELDDRVDTLSRGLLGLTVACARCHDHKYDPISASDYYSLAAAYNGAEWAEVKMAAPAVIAEHQAWSKKKKELEHGLQQWLTEQGSAIARRELNRIDVYLLAAWRSHHKIEPEAATAPLHALFLSRWTKLVGSEVKTKSQILASWAEAARQTTASVVSAPETPQVPESLRKATDQLQRELRSALLAHDRIAEKKKSSDGGKKDQDQKQNDALKLTPQQEELLKAVWFDKEAPFHVTPKEVPSLLDAPLEEHHERLKSGLAQHVQAEPFKPPVAHGVTGGGEAMHVLVRGDVNRAGELAPPGFLPVLRRAGETATTERFTRLDLAEAICTADNPLTARVIVNRIWQHHFGQGMVATASNFGLLGDRPTHPELLDTLTIRFIESGWSIKWLHRQIVTMSAYQLSSYESTHTSRQLEVDPDNRLLWRFSPRRLTVEAWRDAVLAASGQLDRSMGGSAVGRAEDGHPRRTIYSTISRREPDKMLVTFDFPDANVTNERRDITTVPQQQLFVLNSKFMLTAARHLAALATRDGEDDVQSISSIYRLALARDPSAKEVRQASEFLNLARSDGPTLDTWHQLAQAVLASNEFSWID